MSLAPVSVQLEWARVFAQSGETQRALLGLARVNDPDLYAALVPDVKTQPAPSTSIVDVLREAITVRNLTADQCAAAAAWASRNRTNNLAALTVDESSRLLTYWREKK